MLTPGGVDQTITMSGSLRPTSLNAIQTKENMQVHMHEQHDMTVGLKLWHVMCV